MQINSYLYFDLQIPASNKAEFLQPTDLIQFEIIETAGANLPIAVITFQTLDEKIKNCVLENNEFIIKFGESPEKADTFSMRLYGKEKPSVSAGSSGNSGWIISFSGFLLQEAFMFNVENNTYKGKSLTVVKQIIKETFGKDIKTNIIKTEVHERSKATKKETKASLQQDLKAISKASTTGTASTKTNEELADDMTNEKEIIWRRGNKTLASFLVSVILHMDIMPSFPLFAFDKFGNFILRSFDKLVKGGAKYNFICGTPKRVNDIPFYNNFSPEDNRDTYNLFSGFQRVIETLDAETGDTTEDRADNTPMLASSKIAEKSRMGSTVTTNRITTSNVHRTYNKAYAHNTNKLISLGVLCGEVELKGRYYRELAPLDLINLNAGDSKDAEAINGLWMVEAIETVINCEVGVLETFVTISRDNYNYLENYVEKENFLNILKKWMNKISAAIYDFKVAYAQLRRIMDGTFLEEMRAFMVATKTNLLRSFTVLGVPVDFNSSAKLLQSLILIGNSLMNTLVDMVFPAVIANLLRDFIIVKPSLMNLVSNFIAEYVPYDLRDIMSKLFTSLFNVTDSLNSIAKDNGITVTTNTSTGEAAELATTETSETDYTQNAQDRVSSIVEDFEVKTTGLDIPFPVIELTESQSLYSDEELKNYVATATIENLTNLGYLTTVEEEEELKDVLVSDDPNKLINFDLINRINANAGNSYNYRFWGTLGVDQGAMYAWKYEDKVIYTKTDTVSQKTRLYNSDYTPYARIEFQVVEEEKDKFVIQYNGHNTERAMKFDIISNSLAELTSFAIKKSYKDKYRTIPCTKIINASGNRRIYFACPKAETNLRFYVNAKKIELESFSIDLGYVDRNGNPIMYSVYYTPGGYNSSSVMLEVKKGGMV